MICQLRASGLRHVMSSAVLVVVSACKFDPPPPIVDASASPDAGISCEPGAIVCDDDTSRYLECSSLGVVVRQIECPLGCAGGIEKCLDVDPGNALAPYLDSSMDGPSAVFAGSSTIDTSNGLVVNNGVSIDIPSDLFNGMRVFRFNRLTVGGSLKVRGGYALALVVHGDVVIDGLLDVSADAAVSGPGGLPPSASCAGGSSSNQVDPTGGGGGGGRYDTGGAGGASVTGGLGGAGGPLLRDDDIQPLQGGCPGGSVLEDGQSSTGGGGGGAVQIVSRSVIDIRGSGKIDASGGGAQAGPNTVQIGGAGGGSGGAILLEAPRVLLDGSGVILATKGGGGASCSGNADTTSGSDGIPGGVGDGAAPGGSFASSMGGAGGTESAVPGAGTFGDVNRRDGAGGGGSVGQVRFNTTTGSVSPLNGAAIRSRFTTGSLITRLVP